MATIDTQAPGSSTLDELVEAAFPERSAALAGVPPIYTWQGPLTLIGVWPQGSRVRVRFEANPLDMVMQTGDAVVAASGAVSEAPLDGRFYGRTGQWDVVWVEWISCSYPAGCSGTLVARRIGDPTSGIVEVIGQASSVSSWDSSYSFILGYMPPTLTPSTDRFVLVPSSHTPGTPDSISCAWFKPTGEIAIGFIYEKGQNPLIAWFNGVSIQI